MIIREGPVPASSPGGLHVHPGGSRSSGRGSPSLRSFTACALLAYVFPDPEPCAPAPMRLMVPACHTTRCAHAARRLLQAPVLPSPNGRRPSRRARCQAVERRSRLRHAGKPLCRLRQRRPAPALRRALAGIPVHREPVHGGAPADLYRVAVPGPAPPRRAGPGREAAPVLPMVFYNGRHSRWTAPLGVAETLSPVVEALARYQPSPRYFVLRAMRDAAGRQGCR